MPLPDSSVTTVEKIKEELTKAARHRGAHAHSLWLYSQPLVRLLTPHSDDGEQEDMPGRAIAAERRIRTAIEAVGAYDSAAAEALLEILRLKQDHIVWNRVTERRAKASRILNVAEGSFRTKYEDELLTTLAFELWRIISENT